MKLYKVCSFLTHLPDGVECMCMYARGNKQKNIEWEGWQVNSTQNVVNAFSRSYPQEDYLHHFSYITITVVFCAESLQGIVKAFCELT